MCHLFQLLVNLGDIWLVCNGFLGLVQALERRLVCSWNRFLVLRVCLWLRLGGLWCGLLLLLVIVANVPEHVVEDEVAVGLAREDESLDEFAVGQGVVGHLSNDRDNDVVVGGLGVYIGDANLAVLEVEGLDAILDSLASVSVNSTL